MPLRPKTVTKLVCLFFLLFSTLTFSQVAVETDSLLLEGQLDYSSDFFRDRLLHNTFSSFVDNYNDYIIYQTTTHGDFGTPDNTYMSIQGNSYRWNKYYIDGFRMNDRSAPGSYLYEQDLYKRSFNIDTYNSKVMYTSDQSVDNSLLVRYNIGNVGGVTPGTEWFFNLFHPTALQTVYKPIDSRRNMKGQGVAILDFNAKYKDQVLPQHVYVDFGQRELVAFDYAANNHSFYENYAKVEIGGQLPTFGSIFDKVNYSFAYAHRDQFNHELYYGESETGVNDKYSLSLYANKYYNDAQLTTGFNVVRHGIEHNDADFSRNHMDMDGESLFPFYSDVNTTEFSHFIAYDKQLTSKLTFKAEGYNGLIYSTPNASVSSNAVYFESLVNPNDNAISDESDPFYSSLYVCDWSSNTFTTGLLENTAGLYYATNLSDKLSFKYNLMATFDGLLLTDKSLLKPNWETELMLNWHPNTHFSMALNVARKRVAFHYDMAKYLSNDYMNGDAYYWQDANKDKIVQDAERTAYFTSSGGAYRQMDDNIKQPSYLMIEWPILIKITPKHSFSIVTSYRKYINQWQTALAESATEYGSYEKENGTDVFFINSGEPMHYIVNSDRPDAMDIDQTAAFFTNTPFSFTNIAKYSYTGTKAFFSASWVSQYMMNVATLGNSPVESNMETFSDEIANPNGQINTLGRPQQDRGYVARLLYGYKFNESFKASFLLKFVDGQPFSKYNSKIKTDADGNSQIATWRYLSGGASPMNEGWGDREDMGFNTELRLAYTLHLPSTTVEFNVSGYNLIDFAYELISCGYDLPIDRRRASIELCAPRGFMFTTKISL